MSQNFSDKSNSSENQAEIESLVAAFYAGHNLQPGRAQNLWRQLEPRLEKAPARPSLFGSWFKNSNTARNNFMQTETPLFDQDEEIPARPPRRRALAGALLGGLASLVLVAGLILFVFMATGSKYPEAGPSIGSQPGQPAQPTATLVPTSTPLPFNGTAVAGMVDPNASPTPPPYQPPTPTAAGSNGSQATAFPATAGRPSVTPVPGNSQVDPNATSTPTPWDGSSPVSPTAGPGVTPTATPAIPNATSSTDPDPAITLGGTKNVVVKYLQEWPIKFNRNALPPLVRALAPSVNYYGALQDGSTVLAEVHAALVAGGYTYVSIDGTANAAPTWIPTGLAVIYTKAGQPDLYITLAGTPTAEQVKQYLANGFDTGIVDYENVLSGMRGKGIKTVVMVTSAYNLYQVMRNGQDPGAGSPTVSPGPAK